MPIGATIREYLPALIAATEHADVAIGSRYVAGRRHRRLAAASPHAEPLESTALSRAAAAAAGSRFERRVSRLSRRQAARNRFDMHSVNGLRVLGGNPLAPPSRRRNVRRSADHISPAPRRRVKDQCPRSRRQIAHACRGWHLRRKSANGEVQNRSELMIVYRERGADSHVRLIARRFARNWRRCYSQSFGDDASTGKIDAFAEVGTRIKQHKGRHDGGGNMAGKSTR